MARKRIRRAIQHPRPCLGCGLAVAMLRAKRDRGGELEIVLAVPEFGVEGELVLSRYPDQPLIMIDPAKRVIGPRLVRHQCEPRVPDALE